MPTTLITGTNKGIGLEICSQLAARGDDVIAVCRNPSRELSELDVRIIGGIDISKAESIDRLETELPDSSSTYSETMPASLRVILSAASTRKRCWNNTV